MEKTIWIVLALLAGAVLPLQGGLNTKLGKIVESPIHASTISFIIGALGLIIYMLITQQHAVMQNLRSAPAAVWSGGILGAFYVTIVVLAFPKLGPGLTFGLVVAGQMVISLALEHFNILVAQQQSLSWGRIAGICVVILGVILIKKM
ncbi:DMT family transporter [Sphingobacterium sp. SYP-B4668]|uniref:DMT family transporter n=1 Tax=Sphingobacterium sp. SYP-B4668 TaxID=2996035 RepID=UPI0022DD32F2|nr:DMT family transporter [Sphingobacterium sp. SYP-B4668]